MREEAKRSGGAARVEGLEGLCGRTEFWDEVLGGKPEQAS